MRRCRIVRELGQAGPEEFDDVDLVPGADFRPEQLRLAASEDVDAKLRPLRRARRRAPVRPRMRARGRAADPRRLPRPPPLAPPGAASGSAAGPATPP